MKKLYRKGSVHPSPSPPPPTSDHHFEPLAFLPAAILALSAALSTDDKQVLAYLLSCSTTIDFDKKQPTKKTHQTSSTCYCFTCYTTYWSRWDSSPNRQLIHEIIDAFEDHLLTQRKNNNNNNNNNNRRYKKKHVAKRNNHHNVNVDDNNYNNSKVDGSVRGKAESGGVDSAEEGRFGDDETEEKQGSSVRKMVSFLWGTVWG
ncbi:hypothetical protein RND81_07G118000 [Saponaria officinalis]|uniref:Uncharacterized protein n=1 Tax=Saponaria officinalis TaxID=3572 RepID=A0AAW1JTC3_SAPOF